MQGAKKWHHAQQIRLDEFYLLHIIQFMKKILPPHKTLGSTSASLITALLKQDKIIFNIDDALKFSKQNRQAVIKLLHDLLRRKVVARIKSGVYLILQAGQEHIHLKNWPIIAKALAKPHDYFISYYAAMRLHGMTTHPLFNIQITSSKRRRDKSFSNIDYHFIYCAPKHFWGNEKRWVTKQNNVLVSDLERTILDSLERPELCGGLKEIIRGIWSKHKDIDTKKLIAYSIKYRTRAPIQRLAYILETLNLHTELLKPLQKITASAQSYILFDPSGKKIGKYLSKWHIQLNFNIDELKASIWE